MLFWYRVNSDAANEPTVATYIESFLCVYVNGAEGLWIGQLNDSCGKPCSFLFFFLIIQCYALQDWTWRIVIVKLINKSVSSNPSYSIASKCTQMGPGQSPDFTISSLLGLVSSVSIYRNTNFSFGFIPFVSVNFLCFLYILVYVFVAFG